MYLRHLWEQETEETRKSLMDMSELQQTQKSIMAIHNAKTMYARWCATRIHDRMIRMIGREQAQHETDCPANKTFKKQGSLTIQHPKCQCKYAGMAQVKIGLLDVIELAFEDGWLEAEFAKYDVSKDHINLACKLVRELLETNLRIAARDREVRRQEALQAAEIEAKHG